jgi:hypothetical protein
MAGAGETGRKIQSDSIVPIEEKVVQILFSRRFQGSHKKKEVLIRFAADFENEGKIKSILTLSPR